MPRLARELRYKDLDKFANGLLIEKDYTGGPRRRMRISDRMLEPEEDLYIGFYRAETFNKRTKAWELDEERPVGLQEISGESLVLVVEKNAHLLYLLDPNRISWYFYKIGHEPTD